MLPFVWLPQADEGDTYGVKKIREKSSWQVLSSLPVFHTQAVLVTQLLATVGQAPQPQAEPGSAVPPAPLPQIVKMSFTGEALSYFVSSIYTITVRRQRACW